MPSAPSVALTQESDYRFAVRFAPGLPTLTADEPPPLGQGSGPSPVQMLAAAVGNCLAASLVFALRKFRQQAEPVTAEVDAEVGRNPQNRLRVQRLRVRLALGAPAETLTRLDRVLEQFEDFCTVTQSIRPAIPVQIEVRDSRGVPLSRPLAAKEA